MVVTIADGALVLRTGVLDLQIPDGGGDFMRKRGVAVALLFFRLPDGGGFAKEREVDEAAEPLLILLEATNGDIGFFLEEEVLDSNGGMDDGEREAAEG